MGPLIHLENVSKHYGTFMALNCVNLEVAEGEVVSVIGPSGSGKSTLIRCINLLEQHDDYGKITVNGTVVRKGAGLKNVRANVGMVFQNFNLFPHMTILENVKLAPTRVDNISTAVAAKRHSSYWIAWVFRIKLTNILGNFLEVSNSALLLQGH